MHTYIHNLNTFRLSYSHTACILTYLHSHLHTLHYITLRYITLHYTTLHYITLVHTYIHACIHALHDIALHCITLHYTTLHYSTLHYVTSYIRTYIHTSIHASIHTYIHTAVFLDVLELANDVKAVAFFCSWATSVSLILRKRTPPAQRNVSAEHELNACLWNPEAGTWSQRPGIMSLWNHKHLRWLETSDSHSSPLLPW